MSPTIPYIIVNVIHSVTNAREAKTIVLPPKNKYRANFQLSNGEPIQYNNRFFCWTEISHDEKIYRAIETLQSYGIKPGDNILSVRRSGLGVGFIVRGPIIKEAEKHPELKIFE